MKVQEKIEEKNSLWKGGEERSKGERGFDGEFVIGKEDNVKVKSKMKRWRVC